MKHKPLTSNKMKEVIKMTTNEMLAKIRELKELKTMSAELDKEITALKCQYQIEQKEIYL